MTSRSRRKRRTTRQSRTTRAPALKLLACLLVAGLAAQSHAEEPRQASASIRWSSRGNRDHSPAEQHAQYQVARQSSRLSLGRSFNESVPSGKPAVLRWRSPGLPDRHLADQSSSSRVVQATALETANEPHLREPANVQAVQPAVGTLAIQDRITLPPGDDPFDDRTARASEDLDSTARRSSSSSPLEPAMLLSPTQGASREAAQAIVPASQVRTELPYANTSRGLEMLTSQGPGSPEECQVDLKRIGSINLDITATEPIDPADSENRVWRSRSGEEIGRGQLVEIGRGLAVIQTEAGPMQFPLHQLSDADKRYASQLAELPADCQFKGDHRYERQWEPATMTWTASALAHKPLYFEEVQLERYGHTTGPFTQPLVSGAHFFLNIATLPYQAGIHPPHECQYALGYYRPGNCAPWLLPPVPLSLRGGLLQAGVLVGGAAIIP